MRLSLLHGWFPAVLQLAAAAALVFSIGRRERRGVIRRLPLAIVGGVLVAVVAAANSASLTGQVEPLPTDIWVWLGAAVCALLVLVLGWRSAGWWRRGTAVLAAALAALACANGINQTVGYYPTLDEAVHNWNGKTVPGQVSVNQVHGLTEQVSSGKLVAVNIPATYSHFRHREEFVYLPPVWFRSAKRPALPVVEMIGAEYSKPENWIRLGHAVQRTDMYAQTHHGWAPILVFTDATGGFFNDTECVNGPHGNAEDHLVRDIPPYIEHTFGASADPRKWAVLGFSMGGTCAIDLAVEHPSTFGHFVDISGDLGPNTGDKQQTIANLYGGSLAAWQAHDPLTVLGRHGRYRPGTSGWFEDGTDERTHIRQAHELAQAAQRDGISTRVVVEQGGHVWLSAVHAYADVLPWLAQQLGLPYAGTVHLEERSVRDARPVHREHHSLLATKVTVARR